MKSSKIVAFLLVVISKVSSSKISLKSCCPIGEHYDSLNNQCVVSKTSTKNETVDAKFPPVYSKGNGKLVSFNGFQIVEELINCSEGFGVNSLKQFTLYDDGTLETSGTSQHEQGSFCIATSDDSEFVVRLCLPDPCLNETVSCVRKCCPLGSAVNEETWLCDEYSGDFIVEFKDGNGTSFNATSDNFNIREGFLMHCPTGYFNTPVHPDEDPFHILPSGHLYASYDPENPVVREYCLDNFINETVKKAFVCYPSAEGEEMKQEVFAYLMIISALFLIATFVVYAIIPEIRNIHGATIMCHCASLATAFICFAIIQLEKNLSTAFHSCKAIAIIAHFTFLSTFTWLNTMSFDIWWTLTDFRPRSRVRHSGTKIGHRFAYYCIFAWAIPLIIVFAGQLVDYNENAPDYLKPQFASHVGDHVYTCWFPRDSKAIWLWFYGPIAMILVVNLIFFVMTAIRLHRAQRDAAFATKKQKKKKGIVIIFSLFLLMGLTWATEIISGSFEGSSWYAVPTDIVNLLTGVFIFVLFVCKKKVLRSLRKKFLPVERLIRGHDFAMSFSSRGGSQRSTASKRTVALTMSQVSNKYTDDLETETSKLSSVAPEAYS